MSAAAKKIAASLQHGPKPQGSSSRLKSTASVISKSSKYDPALSDPHRKGSAWSITSMPPDIAEMAIDKPYFSANVKAADIARHGRDEQLDQFKRALLCLESKDENQKIFGVQSILSLAIADEERAFKEVYPSIEAELKRNFDPELHKAASTSFSSLITELFKTNPQRGKQLLHVVGSFASCNDIELSNAWYYCLDSLVDSLNSADLQRELVPQITERFGKQGAHPNGRRTAARLINKLSKRLPEEVLTKRILPVIESLMQDIDPAVRGSMVKRIPEVISRLKNKDKAVSLLQNFSHDSDVYLMGAYVEALGKSCTLVNPKDPQALVVLNGALPIMKKLVKKAYVEGHVNILAEFSTHVGQMTAIYSEAGALTPGDKLWFLDAVLQLSRYGLPPTFGGKGKQANNDGGGGGHDMPTGFMNFRANIEFNRRHSLIESLISTGIHKSPANPEGRKGGLTNEATISLLKGNNNAPIPSAAAAGAGGSNKSNTRRLSFAVEQSEESWMCRANIANGFPQFIKFAKPLVDFRNGLHPLVVELMHDPVPGVRIKMAQKLYPVMSFLGNEGAILYGEVVYALSDDNISVIEGVLPNLGDILKLLVQAKLISPDAMTNSMVEIGGAILFCEERLSQSNDWRVHAIMLEQMATLPFCLPGDYVYNNFVPALFHRLLHMRQLPCRIAAGDAIVSFLRHCRRSAQREDIQKKIREGFATGNSVHDRMLFLFMSKKIMEMFSRKYYRDNFFETTLGLTDDTVANIRMKAVAMMPDLKMVLNMSDNPLLLKKLEDTLIRIKNSETDRDVQSVIDAVIPEMAKISVVFKNDKKPNQKTKADLEDEAKEREEAYIASLEPAAGPANPKERRKSLFKSNKRHSDPTSTQPSKSGQPNQPNSNQKAKLAVPSAAPKAAPSTDNTKLAILMKGHSQKEDEINAQQVQAIARLSAQGQGTQINTNHTTTKSSTDKTSRNSSTSHRTSKASRGSKK